MTVSLEFLNLTPPKSRQGTAPAITAILDRKLEVEDIAALSLAKAPAEGPKPIREIRSIHHHAARHLAAGMRPVEVSAITGLAPSTIWRYQQDTSFQELLEHYTKEEDSRYAALRERMARLAEAATDELQERILESPDQVNSDVLVKIMTAAVDRSGEAPIKTQTDHNHAHLHFAAEDVQAMKQDIERLRSGKLNARTPVIYDSAAEDDFPEAGSAEQGAEHNYAQKAIPSQESERATLVPIVIDGARLQTEKTPGDSGGGESL